MFALSRPRLLAVLLLPALLVGCRGSTNHSGWLQLPRDWLFGTWHKTKAEDTKSRALESQKQALEAENRNLQARVNELVAQKEEAENESARLAEELALPRESRTRLASSPGQSRAGQGVAQEIPAGDLRQLAARGELLTYDAQIGGCRLAKELEFQSDAKLHPHSQWVLNDLARTLEKIAPRESRVLIVTRGPAGKRSPAHADGENRADQANTVARYLADEGLADDRIALLAVEDDPRAAGDGDQPMNVGTSPLEVYVLPADRLTVGWEKTLTRKLR